MTLRDLTKRQLYNLRRRCEKLRKQYVYMTDRTYRMNQVEEDVWRKAFNAGLKAGLEIPRA